MYQNGVAIVGILSITSFQIIVLLTVIIAMSAMNQKTRKSTDCYTV
jgi:hypothetical protein